MSTCYGDVQRLGRFRYGEHGRCLTPRAAMLGSFTLSIVQTYIMHCNLLDLLALLSV